MLITVELMRWAWSERSLQDMPCHSRSHYCLTDTAFILSPSPYLLLSVTTPLFSVCCCGWLTEAFKPVHFHFPLLHPPVFCLSLPLQALFNLCQATRFQWTKRLWIINFPAQKKRKEKKGIIEMTEGQGSLCLRLYLTRSL